MKKSLIILVVLSVAVCSCVTKTSVGGRQAIPYVGDILSGKVPGAQLFDCASDAGRNGQIYLFGSVDVCSYLCDSLMVMDRHDNASGQSCGDYLPDFCGETFVCVIDSTGRDGADFLIDRDTVGLRRQAVNMLLASLDSVCYLSRFDNSGLGRKMPAKQIILSDPIYALYGKFDIDTLLSASSCDVKLLIPVLSAFDVVLSGRDSAPNVGVMSPFCTSDFPLYSDIFNDCCNNAGIRSSGNVFCDSVCSLRDYMDSYLQSGNTAPLDAVVVDCYKTDINVLYHEYARLNDVKREDYSRYGNLFAPDFRLISALHCVTEESYSDIRSRNLFSHNISWPAYKSYCYVCDSEDNSAIKIIECSK